MKKAILYILIQLISFTFFAQNNFIIKGKVKESKTNKVWIYNSDNTISDTISLTKRGKFTYKGNVEEQELFYIQPIESQDYSLFVVRPGSEIYFEIKVIKADLNIVMKKVSESPIVYEYLEKSNQFLREIKNLDDSLNLSYSADDQYYFDSLYIAKTTDFHNYRNKFIKENAKSLKVLSALNHLNLSVDLEQLKQMKKGLETHHSDKEFFKKINTSIYKIEMHSKKAGKVGEQAPILILPGLNGEDISLEKLRGNYVLIDFWASWCKPCRAEHPRLVSLYKELNNKGFEVYSISLDSKKKRWQNAINTDKLYWKTHVSNLNSFNSPAVKMYDVGAVPFSVLLDRQGKIIAYNLRGAELEFTLRKLLK